MTEGNEGNGIYSCPECGESFDNPLNFGRHARNMRPEKKHLKAVKNTSNEPRDIKADFDRVPADDFDQLEIVLTNARHQTWESSEY